VEVRAIRGGNGTARPALLANGDNQAQVASSEHGPFLISGANFFIKLAALIFLASHRRISCVAVGLDISTLQASS